MDDLEPGARNAERALNSATARTEEPLLHWWFDSATKWLLYFTVVFAPWAFGTTQPWSIGVMNVAGCLLGGLLAGKWTVRWATGWEAAVPAAACEARPKGARWPLSVLAGLTVLMLGYCLTSAVNARATYLTAERGFDYHDCLAWLPHSYDSTSSWRAFWAYLALAAMFWGARDWIMGGRQGPTPDERGLAGWRRGLRLPERLQRLLWLVSVNGALLALEGTLQRTCATNRLLWLVQPFYDKNPDNQFGPYAYRGNAAQYLGLVWPLTLGFWCLLRLGATHKLRQRSTANLLLPCAMLTAIAPLISLSRAGALISCGTTVMAAILLLGAGRQAGWKWKLGLAGFLAAVLALGWLVGWTGLAKRFKTTQEDFASGRGRAWQVSLRMARDYPVFGTGPGTFESVYQLYRRTPYEDWFAFAHNDWLETVVTFGRVGFSGVVFMLILAVSGWSLRCGSIPAHRVLVRFLWLSLAGCLLYAVVDFPFQIYSVRFLFLLVCSILSCLSRPG